MPRAKTKKFIDKKNAVTFRLVHRSQQDPLAADETAPQRVLVPISEQPSKSDKKSVDPKKRKEEQNKYGIFFDDDYDYLQHLRDVNSTSVEWEEVERPVDRPKINLPSSLFASAVEEEVGLLNKAAPISGPRLDVDPDIVAALDEDFDFDDPENQLEDNFLELANAEAVDDELDENDEFECKHDKNEDQGSEDGSDGSSVDRMEVSDEEETKSRFTEYSMSSSVIKRNTQLAFLDDKFERMFAGYDESEIGPLDCEEIEGYVDPDSAVILQCAEEFEKKQKEDVENMAKLMRDRMKVVSEDYPSSEDDDDLIDLVVEAREREKWDCESILSTYSNIYNHPKLISEPKSAEKIEIDPKTGIPKNVLRDSKGKLTAKALARLDVQNSMERPRGPQSLAETAKSTLSVLSVRPKSETPEEKRERKKNLKEYRKERRIERKANIEAFKEEKKLREKINLNCKQNQQGNRIL